MTPLAAAPAAPTPNEDGPRPSFAVRLTPHRSLSRAGFVLVMAAIAAVSFTAGAFFALRGAWPVFGFFGLDVLLIYAALKLSYRSGREAETLDLYDDALIVRRFRPDGRMAEWRLQPYWLRVELEDTPTRGAELALASHGRRLVIGRFLAPDERASLARALKRALARAKTPGTPGTPGGISPAPS